jgi:hypothetical protein
MPPRAGLASVPEQSGDRRRPRAVSLPMQRELSATYAPAQRVLTAHRSPDAHGVVVDGRRVHVRAAGPKPLHSIRSCAKTCSHSTQRSSEASLAPLPAFVRDEFEGYVDCGVLARGFALLKSENPGCRDKSSLRFVAKAAVSVRRAWAAHGRNRSQFSLCGRGAASEIPCRQVRRCARQCSSHALARRATAFGRRQDRRCPRARLRERTLADTSMRVSAVAEFMKRSFAIEVDKCDQCGARLRLRALVTAVASIDRFLRHLGEPPPPPPLPPTRGPPFSRAECGDANLVSVDGIAERQRHMFLFVNGRGATVSMACSVRARVCSQTHRHCRCWRLTVPSADRNAANTSGRSLVRTEFRCPSGYEGPSSTQLSDLRAYLLPPYCGFATCANSPWCSGNYRLSTRGVQKQTLDKSV